MANKDITFRLTAQDSVSPVFQKLGVNAKSLGGVFGAAAAAIGTGLSVSVKRAAEFEKSMSRVGALSGAVGSQMDRLTQTAKNLGATTSFTAKEAAEGMSFLAMAGFETNDIISAMPGVLSAAAAGQLELGRTADITSNILTGFGLQANQTTMVADVLTKSFTSANVTMEQLGEAMKFVAPVAKGMNISLEESAAAISKMGDAGIQGSLAGTSLRTSLLSLAAPSKAAKELMSELGINIKDANGEMLPLPQLLSNIDSGLSGMTNAQRTAALETLVGARAISGFSVIVDAAADGSLQNFTTTLENAGGTADRIAGQQLNNLSGQMTLLQSAIDGVAISIGDIFVPSLTEGARTMTQSVSIWQQNIEQAKLLAGAIGETSTAQDAGTATVNTFNSALETVRRGLGSYYQAIGDGAVVITKAVVGEEELTKAVVAATKNVNTQAVSMGNLGREFANLQFPTRTATESVTEYTDAAVTAWEAQTKLNEALLEMGVAEDAARGLDAQAARLKGLASAYGVAGPLASQGQADFTRVTPDQFMQAQAKAQEDLLDSMQSGAESAANSMKSAFESAFNDLKNTVSSFVQPTLDEVFKVPTEAPRFDEDARRLATVATSGFGSEWLTQLASQFEGEDFFQPVLDAMQAGDESALKTAAQDILKNNVTALWDPEVVKQQVRDAVQQSNLREEFINAITEELAGEGLAMPDGESPVAGLFGGEGESPLAGLFAAGGEGGEAPQLFPPEMFAGIQEQFGEILPGILATFLETYNGVIEQLNLIASTYIETDSQTWTTFLQNKQSAWETAWANIQNTLSTAASNLLTISQNTAQGIHDAFANQDWVGLGKQIGKGIASGLRSQRSHIIDIAEQVATAALKAAKKKLGVSSPSKAFAEIGEEAMRGLALGIIKNAHVALEATDDATDSLINSTLSAFGSAFGQVANSFLNIGQGILTLRKNSFRTMLMLANDTDTAAMAQEGLNKAFADGMVLQKEMQRLAENQQQFSFLKQQLDLLEFLKKQGLNAADVLEGLTLGLDASIPDLVQAMNRALEATIKAANDTLQAKSPSKVFSRIGKSIMTGLEKGIKASQQMPLSATDNAIQSVINNASTKNYNLTINNPTATDTDIIADFNFLKAATASV